MSEGNLTSEKGNLNEKNTETVNKQEGTTPKSGLSALQSDILPAQDKPTVLELDPPVTQDEGDEGDDIFKNPGDSKTSGGDSGKKTASDSISLDDLMGDGTKTTPPAVKTAPPVAKTATDSMSLDDLMGDGTKTTPPAVKSVPSEATKASPVAEKTAPPEATKASPVVEKSVPSEATKASPVAEKTVPPMTEKTSLDSISLGNLMGGASAVPPQPAIKVQKPPVKGENLSPKEEISRLKDEVAEPPLKPVFVDGGKDKTEKKGLFAKKEKDNNGDKSVKKEAKTDKTSKKGKEDGLKAEKVHPKVKKEKEEKAKKEKKAKGTKGAKEEKTEKIHPKVKKEKAEKAKAEKSGLFGKKSAKGKKDEKIPTQTPTVAANLGNLEQKSKEMGESIQNLPNNNSGLSGTNPTGAGKDDKPFWAVQQELERKEKVAEAIKNDQDYVDLTPNKPFVPVKPSFESAETLALNKQKSDEVWKNSAEAVEKPTTTQEGTPEIGKSQSETPVAPGIPAEKPAVAAPQPVAPVKTQPPVTAAAPQPVAPVKTQPPVTTATPQPVAPVKTQPPATTAAPQPVAPVKTQPPVTTAASQPVASVSNQGKNPTKKQGMSTKKGKTPSSVAKPTGKDAMALDQQIKLTLGVVSGLGVLNVVTYHFIPDIWVLLGSLSLVGSCAMGYGLNNTMSNYKKREQMAFAQELQREFQEIQQELNQLSQSNADRTSDVRDNLEQKLTQWQEVQSEISDKQRETFQNEVKEIHQRITDNAQEQQGVQAKLMEKFQKTIADLDERMEFSHKVGLEQREETKDQLVELLRGTQDKVKEQMEELAEQLHEKNQANQTQQNQALNQLVERQLREMGELQAQMTEQSNKWEDTLAEIISGHGASLQTYLAGAVGDWNGALENFLKDVQEWETDISVEGQAQTQELQSMVNEKLQTLQENLLRHMEEGSDDTAQEIFSALEGLSGQLEEVTSSTTEQINAAHQAVTHQMVEGLEATTTATNQLIANAQQVLSDKIAEEQEANALAALQQITALRQAIATQLVEGLEATSATTAQQIAAVQKTLAQQLEDGLQITATSQQLSDLEQALSEKMADMATGAQLGQLEQGVSEKMAEEFAEKLADMATGDQLEQLKLTISEEMAEEFAEKLADMATGEQIGELKQGMLDKMAEEFAEKLADMATGQQIGELKQGMLDKMAEEFTEKLADMATVKQVGDLETAIFAEMAEVATAKQLGDLGQMVCDKIANELSNKATLEQLNESELAVSIKIEEEFRDRLADMATGQHLKDLSQAVANKIEQDISLKMNNVATSQQLTALEQAVSHKITTEINDKLGNTATAQQLYDLEQSVSDKITEEITEKLRATATAEQLSDLEQAVTDKIAEEINDKLANTATSQQLYDLEQAVSEEITEKISEKLGNTATSQQLQALERAFSDKLVEKFNETATTRQLSVVQQAIELALEHRGRATHDELLSEIQKIKSSQSDGLEDLQISQLQEEVKGSITQLSRAIEDQQVALMKQAMDLATLRDDQQEQHQESLEQQMGMLRDNVTVQLDEQMHLLEKTMEKLDKLEEHQGNDGNNAGVSPEDSLETRRALQQLATDHASKLERLKDMMRTTQSAISQQNERQVHFGKQLTFQQEFLQTQRMEQLTTLVDHYKSIAEGQKNILSAINEGGKPAFSPQTPLSNLDRGSILDMPTQRVDSLDMTAIEELELHRTPVEAVEEPAKEVDFDEGLELKHQRIGGKLRKTEGYRNGILEFVAHYDSGGNMRERSTFLPNGDLSMEQNFYPSGQCSKLIEYSKRGGITQRVTTDYKENGQRIGG